MKSSVQEAPENFFARNKPTGHLHKGHSTVAATASIPSKYQAIVIKNDEKHGFNSGSKRFSANKFEDSPGPAKYDITQIKIIESNASLSRKGLGGFVSKVKRFPVRLNKDNFVGPGQYDPKLQQNHDFNKARCTSNFHKPLVTTKDTKKHVTPAPNQYNISRKIVNSNVSNSNNAAFLSRTNRESMGSNGSATFPAPGSYDINDDLTRPSARAAQAPFKSTTSRMFLPADSENPGPGTYYPFERFHYHGNKRPPRKHYLCISAPALPMPPIPPSPGPGQYNLVDYQGPAKELISSSVFLSTTNRWNNKFNKKEPGPGSYNPQSQNKQSFIYNVDKKWI